MGGCLLVVERVVLLIVNDEMFRCSLAFFLFTFFLLHCTAS